MNKTDRVLQFQVWNECNNFCTFCTNKEIYDITNEEKLRNLRIIENKIDNFPNQFSILGLIGGEFFQGQLRDNAVKKQLYTIISKINQLLNDKKLNEYWVTATLISEDQQDLFYHLSLIDDVSKVWICTSYDSKGRFHNGKAKECWINNMKKLKQTYPSININTTSILTGSFIEEYINGSFKLQNFCKEFQTSWFGKPPILPINSPFTKKQFNEKVLKDFFPYRNRFLEFLLKFKTIESEFDYNRLFSNQFRADELIQPDNNNVNNRAIMKRNKQQDSEFADIVSNNDFVNGIENVIQRFDTPNTGCKHNKTYTPYVDSEKCFYCDKEMIKNL